MLAAGCGSVTGSAGSAASPSASVSAASSAAVACGQVTALRTSLTSLAKLKPGPHLASQSAGDLHSISREMAALGGQASGPFSAEASQLSAALSQLAGDARTLAAHPDSAHLAVLASAVGRLKATSRSALTPNRGYPV
jgi:hypothetical protein